MTTDQELIIEALRNDARNRADRARRCRTDQTLTARRLDAQAARLRTIAAQLDADLLRKAAGR